MVCRPWAITCHIQPSAEFEVTHYLAQAPLKLRPYGAIQISLLLLIYYCYHHYGDLKGSMKISNDSFSADTLYCVICRRFLLSEIVHDDNKIFL